MNIDLIDPVSYIFKAFSVCAVVGENNSLSSPIVSLSYSSKSFLSCGVPYLNFHIFALKVNGVYFEVDYYYNYYE